MSDHRSASQLTSYIRCGESYRLQRLVRYPQTPAGWTIQGNAFHLAIEFFERNLREDPAATVEVYNTEYLRLVDKYRETWPDVDTWLTGGRVKGSDDVQRRLLRGREQVEKYMAWAVLQPWFIWELPDGSPAVEVPFQIVVGDVPVQGLIDQVREWPDGTLEVVDLKTGSKLPGTNWQLDIYRLALLDLFGVDAKVGSYYMAKDTADVGPYDLATGLVEDLIRDMDKAVRAEIFLPNPGDACRTCSVVRGCRAMGGSEELMPEGYIGSEEK